MKTNKLITEAIEAVMGTGFEGVLDRIKSGVYECTSCTPWGSDIELELTNKENPDNTLLIECEITYDIVNYRPGDKGDYWTPPSSPDWDIDNINVVSATISDEENNEMKVTASENKDVCDILSDMIDYEVVYDMSGERMEREASDAYWDEVDRAYDAYKDRDL